MLYNFIKKLRILLKNLVLCPNCNKINLKKSLKSNEVAVCSYCGSIVYRSIKNLDKKLFSFAFSGLIFLIISLFYPIINLEIVGYYGVLDIIDTIIYLFENGYVFISLFTFFTIVFFPFLILINVLLFSFTLKYKKLAKFLLINITILKDFVYLDIFFIAILVSMVKIFDYGYLSINVGFFSFIVVFIIFFILFKYYNISMYWDLFENV